MNTTQKEYRQLLANRKRNGGTREESPEVVELPFGKRQQLSRPKRANKYNAVRAKSNLTNRWYDSKAERDYAEILRLRELTDEIAYITAQPVIDLTCEIKYKCDFRYFEIKTNRWIYAEVKGVETERFRMIKKLWRYHGDGLLQIIKRKSASSPFIVTQEIFPIT